MSGRDFAVEAAADSGAHRIAVASDEDIFFQMMKMEME
jgi:hypothetical protein